MKRSTKRDIAISCFVLAFGCFLMAAGWGMGGRLSGGREVNIGGANGIYMGSEGLMIGGSHGIYVGPYGISVGGPYGIYVGPEGIRIGSSGAATGIIDQITIIEPVFEDDMVVQGFDVEAFADLEVEIDLGDVTVEHGTGYSLTLATNVKNYQLRYGNEDGHLRIWSEGNGANHLGATDLSAYVVITVPVSCKIGDVTIRTDLGDVSWKAKATVGVAELGTKLGDVSWTGQSQANFVVLESDLGDIGVYRLTAKELRTFSNLGDIRIEVPSSGREVSYDLSTAMGNVSLYGTQKGQDYSYTARNEDCYIEARCSLGDIWLTHPTLED